MEGTALQGSLHLCDESEADQFALSGSTWPPPNAPTVFNSYHDQDLLTPPNRGRFSWLESTCLNACLVSGGLQYGLVSR